MISRRLLAVWVALVLLAVAVPVAVPYAVFAGDESCEPQAAQRLRDDGRFGGRGMPLSFEVQRCILISNQQADVIGEVTVHGPYGIPVAEYAVSAEGIMELDAAGNMMLASVAVLVGVAIVSAPFVFLLVRRVVAVTQRRRR